MSEDTTCALHHLWHSYTPCWNRAKIVPGQWALQLLADRLGTLEIVEAIGKKPVHRMLRKMLSSRGGKNTGYCRNEGSTDDVCALEDGLEGYA